MICKHFQPMKPEILAVRRTQLNNFVLKEASIMSFIKLFRDLGFFHSSKLEPNASLALARFERAFA